MAIEINFDYIQVNSYTGAWAPAHQTAARHHLEMYGRQCFYVEVSEEQFYAAIRPGDIVSEAKTDSAGQIYTRFSIRHRADEVGRAYGDGVGNNVYLLEVSFAERHRDVLTELCDQAQVAADDRRRQRQAA